MGSPTWMYSLDCPRGRVFDSDEIPAGWVDSPAKLDKRISGMSKDELEATARGFGVELDKRRSRAALIKQVEALADGDTE